MLDILRQGAQSWGIKILFGIIIAVFVLAFGMNRVQHDAGAVVATVNDTPILFAQFQDRLQRSLEMARSQNPNLTAEMLAQMGFKRQILDQMIAEELMLQQAASLGLNVSKEELAKEIHLIPAFQNDGKMFDPTTYQNVLKANNLTPGKFESEYMRNLIMQKLQTYVGDSGHMDETQVRDLYDFGRSTAVISYISYPLNEYINKTTPTEEEIVQYYDSNKNKFSVPEKSNVSYVLINKKSLSDFNAVSSKEIEEYYEKNKEDFKVEEQVNARHILVRLAENATEAESKKALAKINEAQSMLKSGKSFQDVATKITEDPSGTKDGGNLGWFGRGKMVKPFEDAAFSLQKGSVSTPVRTQFGFHLIQVVDTKVAGYESFKDVVDDILVLIAEERATEALQDKLDQALEIILSGGSLETVVSSIGLKLEVQETGFFTKQAGPSKIPGISQDTTAALFDLPINATTQSPLPVSDGYLLATKKTQTAETFLSMDEAKPRIMASVKQEKALQLSKAAAENDLASVSKGGPLSATNSTPIETKPFTRQGPIAGLGANQQLLTAAFSAKPGTWLPEPFAFPTGYVLAKTVSVTPPSAEEWNAEKERWIAAINQRAEQQSAQAFLGNLRSKADVRITNPALIEN